VRGRSAVGIMEDHETDATRKIFPALGLSEKRALRSRNRVREQDDTQRTPGSSARDGATASGTLRPYRGARQELPGPPTSLRRTWHSAFEVNTCKSLQNLCECLRQPWAKRRTGVLNKNYRGARQELPGLPAKITGAPDKNYRGSQQKLPGCPTSAYRKYAAKWAIFCPVVAPPCSYVLSGVMLLNNYRVNCREDGGNP
jgi:hypothetical protein